jgi:iron-sulfur cluster repair protein YtfE (RIC family)
MKSKFMEGSLMKQTEMVSADATVNEVIRAFPATVAVFHGYGIDACCGGDLPVRVAAEHHGVPLEKLLEELEQKAARDRA